MTNIPPIAQLVPRMASNNVGTLTILALGLLGVFAVVWFGRAMGAREEDQRNASADPWNVTPLHRGVAVPGIRR